MARWDLISNDTGIQVTYTNEMTGEVWNCGNTTSVCHAWAFLVQQKWDGEPVYLDDRPFVYRPTFMAAA
jgi:hypothetical protein